jgi:hypothetical protein
MMAVDKYCASRVYSFAGQSHALKTHRQSVFDDFVEEFVR